MPYGAKVSASVGEGILKHRQENTKRVLSDELPSLELPSMVEKSIDTMSNEIRKKRQKARSEATKTDGSLNLVTIGNKVLPTVGVESGVFSTNISNTNDMGLLFQANNLYNRSDIDWYRKFNRFGVLDPYNALTNTREYLFFTKPDLHICEPGTTTLNPELANNEFFVEMFNRYPEIIAQLQKSIYDKKSTVSNPFMTVLSNSVKNKLDMPEISANTIDTAATIFGTSINYRGDAFNSGEKYEFSLEFEDTKYLELYHLFKAIEEYSQLKKFGIVTPPNVNKVKADENGYAFSQYIQNKELHDQFSIYKFIVDEDYQDIIYYAMFVGVFAKSVPREVFSDIDPNGGLRYNIQFEAQFVDDMKPYILADFNNLINDTMLDSIKTPLEVYNPELGTTDGRWAKAPYVCRQYKSDTNPAAWLAPNSMQYKYQLRWRI